MAPPEVILDRWVRTQRHNRRELSGYLGKLDVERIKSPSFRSFLYLVKDSMNEALRLEGVNASGGVNHPPFHFDYLDVSSEIRNAHAFQHAGFSFIVVTLPMVELLGDASQRLSRSPLVHQQLGLDGGADVDALHGLLLLIQLNFLVSHEYTHHIHQHTVGGQSGVIGVWTEFPEDAICGNIDGQAQELDADGYAVYLVLAHLLRGDMRRSALAGLGRTDMQDADELLLTCFFLAVLAFLCTSWRGGIEMTSVRELTHPPPPLRIKYAINVAEMWCGQNGAVSGSWFAPARLQALFSAASGMIEEGVKETWDAHMSFLRSADGEQYDQQLLEAFEAIRRKPDEPVGVLGP